MDEARRARAISGKKGRKGRPAPSRLGKHAPVNGYAGVSSADAGGEREHLGELHGQAEVALDLDPPREEGGGAVE